MVLLSDNQQFQIAAQSQDENEKIKEISEKAIREFALEHTLYLKLLEVTDSIKQNTLLLNELIDEGKGYQCTCSELNNNCLPVCSFENKHK
eukprot:Pgem_evm1s149